MTDPNATIVRWTPISGSAQRFVFEPRVDGYYRRHEIWTDDHWRELGCEIVNSVGFENVPADAVD